MRDNIMSCLDGQAETHAHLHMYVRGEFDFVMRTGPFQQVYQVASLHKYLMSKPCVLRRSPFTAATITCFSITMTFAITRCKKYTSREWVGR